MAHWIVLVGFSLAFLCHLTDSTISTATKMLTTTETAARTTKTTTPTMRTVRTMISTSTTKPSNIPMTAIMRVLTLKPEKRACSQCDKDKAIPCDLHICPYPKSETYFKDRADIINIGEIELMSDDDTRNLFLPSKETRPAGTPITDCRTVTTLNNGYSARNIEEISKIVYEVKSVPLGIHYEGPHKWSSGSCVWNENLNIPYNCSVLTPNGIKSKHCGSDDFKHIIFGAHPFPGKVEKQTCGCDRNKQRGLQVILTKLDNCLRTKCHHKQQTVTPAPPLEHAPVITLLPPWEEQSTEAPYYPPTEFPNQVRSGLNQTPHTGFPFGGIIAIVVVACVLVLGSVTATVVVCYIKKKKKKPKKPKDAPSDTSLKTAAPLSVSQIETPRARSHCEILSSKCGPRHSKRTYSVSAGRSQKSVGAKTELKLIEKEIERWQKSLNGKVPVYKR